MRKKVVYFILVISILLSLYFALLYQRPINWFLRENKAALIFNRLLKSEVVTKIKLDKVFFINLLQNKERHAHVKEMQAYFKETPTEIFPAIYGKHLSQQEIADYVFKGVFKKNIEEILKPGEIGVALSHYYLWNKVASDPDIKHALILEDDAAIDEHFETKWEQEYPALPEDYDIIYLYHYAHVTHLVPTNFNQLYIPLYPTCAHGYIISKKGAEKLLKGIFPLDKPIDNAIADFYKEGVSLGRALELYQQKGIDPSLFRAYLLKPDLVWTKGFSSTIQKP